MRNIRVFYKKMDKLKFVSHLDMNRYMLRLVKLSGLPIWYSEGFNPRAHITFALPLSLGYESEYEVVDMKITDDNFTNSQVKAALNSVVVKGLEIINVCDPIGKPSEITYAGYKFIFDCNESELNDFKKFMKRDAIQVFKKNKKGIINSIDIAPKIKNLSFGQLNGETVMKIVMPAGGNENLNPVLALTAFENESKTKLPPAAMVRTMLYNSKMEIFE